MPDSGSPPGLLEVATMVHLVLGMLRAPVRTGRLDLAFVTREIPDPAACVFCMCGPGEMIEGFKTATCSPKWCHSGCEGSG